MSLRDQGRRDPGLSAARFVVVARAPEGSAIGIGNYLAHGGFAPHGFGGLWSAVFVSIFSYLGIEMIAGRGGEAVDPERAIVRAFRATMLRLAIFYLARWR